MNAALRLATILVAVVAALAAFGSRSATAHEIRPAYLEIGAAIMEKMPDMPNRTINPASQAE